MRSGCCPGDKLTSTYSKGGAKLSSLAPCAGETCLAEALVAFTSCKESRLEPPDPASKLPIRALPKLWALPTLLTREERGVVGLWSTGDDVRECACEPPRAEKGGSVCL